MDRGDNPPWDQLGDKRREEWARRMEVFAAQTEHMDRCVGRLLTEIKRLGIEENTLVLFLSDNGGAAEDPNSGDKSAPIGSRDSYRGYGRPWATVSNTPWRRHKVSAYEGGISTPLLARWPAGIPPKKRGTLVRDPAHIIDLLPTLVELAGLNLPESSKGQLEGKSLAAMIKGEPGGANRVFCWEHEGNRAIRQGKWKLVAPRAGDVPWELYDIESDRIESRDLAGAQPEIVKELKTAFESWATRCGVIDYAQLISKSKPAAEGKK
jgi:arylsulfatase